MISVEVFMFILMAISVVTSLIVEAIKTFYKADCYNIIAGIVALILTVCVAVFYALWCEIAPNAKYIIFFICVALASWLSAMLGFDKVKQALSQLRM